MLTNTRSIHIEWGQCDPAGIVFYPRYFEIFDASTTALFERALGMTKYEFVRFYGFVGYPMVDTRARFLMPTRYGDKVSVETSVTEFHRSSFEVRHVLSKDGRLAVEGFETRVWVQRDPEDLQRIHAIPVPKEVVEKLSAG